MLWSIHLSLFLALNTVFGPTTVFKHGSNEAGPQSLGQDGYEALTKPEAVTIQAVCTEFWNKDPVVRRRKELIPTGPEMVLPSGQIVELIRAFEAKLTPNRKACTFHPDHIIRFKRGPTVLEIVTCFTCKVIRIGKNGAGLGGSLMPRSSAFENALHSVPLEHRIKARADEAAHWIGYYEALSCATSATAQRIEVDQSSFVPKWEITGPPVNLSAALMERIRSQIILYHSLDERPIRYRERPTVSLGSDLLVTLNADKPIRLIFSKHHLMPTIQIRPDGHRGRDFQSLFRDSLFDELSQLEL